MVEEVVLADKSFIDTAGPSWLDIFFLPVLIVEYPRSRTGHFSLILPTEPSRIIGLFLVLPQNAHPTSRLLRSPMDALDHRLN